MICPNINDNSWKQLVASRGENTAYFLWNKYEGKVPESEFSFSASFDLTPQQFIGKLKNDHPNQNGFFKPITYTNLQKAIYTYNRKKGKNYIVLKQAVTGNYFVIIDKNPVPLNYNSSIQVERTENNTKDNIKNDGSINTSNNKLGFNTEFKDNHSKVNFILNKIANSNSDSIPIGIKYLANWFKKLPNDYKNVPVKLVEPNPKWKGLYSNERQEIEIINNLPESELAKVFLHELIHHLVNGAIYFPEGSAQRNTVIKLKYLFTTAKKAWEDKIGKEITVDFIEANPNMEALYGLTSFEEFLPELLSSKIFQEVLSDNRIKFKADQTFIDRFKQIIHDLFQAINKLIFNKELNNEFLKTALSQAIDLINNVTESNINQITPDKEFFSINPTSSTIDNFISKLETRIEKLEEDLRKEKNLTRKKELESREDKLKEQVKQLKEVKDLNYITEIAKENLNYVSKLLGKKDLKEADIIEIQNFLALYSNITNTVLSNEDKEDTEVVDNEGNIILTKNEIYRDLLAIETDVKTYSEKMFKLHAQYLKDLHYNVYGQETTEEELFKIKEDIGGLSTNTLSVGRQGVKLLSIKESLNKVAVNRANNLREKLAAEHKQLIDKVKNNSLFKTKGFDIFKQLDADKNWSGNLINKFNVEYHKTFSKYGGNFYKALQKSNLESNKSIIKQYFDWYNQNHIVIDYSKLEDKEYIKTLSEQLGEKHTKSLIEQAKEKLEAFQIAEKEYLDWLEDNEVNPDKRQIAHYNWSIINSPFKAFEATQGKDYTLFSGLHPRYYKKDFVTASPISKHFDSNYENIENNPELEEYLDFVSNTMNRLIDNLPSKYLSKKGLSKNFLPIINKDLIDKYAKEGELGSYKSAFGEWAINLISDTEKSDIKSVDEVTGRPDFQLNVAGLNPITKYDIAEKKYIRDTTKQSDDVFKAIDLAISSIANYEHKSSIEDTYKLVSRGFEYVGVNDFGINVNKNELKNVKTLNEFSDKVFYDKNNDIGKGFEKKVLNAEEQKDKTSLEKRLAEIEEEIKIVEAIKDKKGLNELMLEKDTIKQVIKKLGKNISLDRTGRNLLKYVQLKSMAFNIFSSTNEFVFGIVSNFIYSTGNEVFSTKDWKKALGIMLTNFKIYGKGFDNKKINNLFKIYGVDEHSVIENSDLSSKVENHMYKFQMGSEKFTRGVTLIATMLATKVQTENGEISLWDLYNEEGKIDNSKLSKEQIENWNTETKGTELNEYDRFNNKIKGLFNKLHGNYDTSTPILFKSTLLGLAVSQFRTWIYEGVASRLEKEHYDANLQLQLKGRYRTMTTGKAWSALANYLMFKDDAFEGLESVDEANIKKNVTEVSLAIGLYLTMLIIMQLKGDDEDDENASFYALNSLINVGFRLQSDLFFYINPEEVEKLNSKFIPATVLMNDVYDFAEAAKRQVIGEGTIQKGIYKNHNMLFKEAMQFIPIGNTIYKDIALANRTVDKISK